MVLVTGAQGRSSEALKKFSEWTQVNKRQGTQRRVALRGLDEVPSAYKDIDAIMLRAARLVDIVAGVSAAHGQNGWFKDGLHRPEDGKALREQRGSVAYCVLLRGFRRFRPGGQSPSLSYDVPLAASHRYYPARRLITAILIDGHGDIQ
ncbi:MAG: hypothetical protein U0528_21125 [Anaerolineae bacterium]